jgi:hypothetical protein
MGDLSDDLNRLRKGRGVMASDLQDRIGPTLRTLSGISCSDTPGEARRRLVTYLKALTVALPEDLRLALSAALALDDDVRHRFLEERMQWLAARLNRELRTARRRVDEAIRSTALLSATPASDDYSTDRWYLARFRALLTLDGNQPMAIEERSLVANNDDLSEIMISTSVPRTATADNGDHSVDLAVLYGGSVTRTERPSVTYFRYFIRFPRPLQRGETHDIGISLTIPPGQPMNQRYSFQPLRRCDEFDLRIRFGPSSQAKNIWNMAGVPRGVIDDFAALNALVCPDGAGEVHLRYEHLRIGFIYGVRWDI